MQQVGPVPVQVVEAELESGPDRGLLPEQLREHVRGVDQPLQGRSRLPVRPEHRRPQDAGRRLLDRRGDGRLVLEVEVQRAGADAGPGADVGQLGLGVAMTFELLRGGVDEGLPGLSGTLLSCHHASASRAMLLRD